jgi:glycosyltransferase involved in cell wall biosynthesis
VSPAPAGAGLVAINGRAAIRAQVGGVERMAREMVRHLPAVSPQRYRVIWPPSRFAHRAGHLWEQAVLPIRTAGFRLVYSPANLAPLVSRRNVLVIHDLAALRHPEAYSRGYVSYQRVMLPALARRALLLITVSEFSRSELADLLKLSPARIRVIPEGVDEHFAAAAEPGRVAARYGLERPYVLAVATESERKNLTVLEAAAHALSRQGIEVVLAGAGRPYLRSGGTTLKRLGYVPDEDLPGLYAGALALAMPSLYEGFGLPCLEAMACGTPVVAAAAGALPETVGRAGILVGPHDADAFAEGLLRLASDRRIRDDLIAAGHQRVRGFSWRRTAELTDAAIGEALADL